MFAFLWRMLLFISALWFVQRLLGSLFGTAKRRPGARDQAAKTQSARMVKDPVCGMYLDPRLALALEQKQGTCYFCSEECRKKYLANPL
jgi:uncharacterized protein